MDYKEEFLKIYERYINRDGSTGMLEWLMRSDFFTAPASTRFHLSEPGGLCKHSVNVYKRLVDEFEAEIQTVGNGLDKRVFGSTEDDSARE